ncbi:MAG TPA: serine hydrolase domain-containing protein [Rubrobacteraceae bacterium]|nr:serine hydrolase domain-containing protein [Rubrobacteraceae bacterium]
MTTDGITPRADARGGVVDGDAHLHKGERKEAAIPPLDPSALKARVDEILYRRPAVGLAVGVVRDGSLESFYGHGVADIASGTPVTEDTVFRIGSITKTFTAIAVMQLCERGLVELDAPANGYLRAFELVPAKTGWRPATVRHLLTHTAGVPKLVRPSRALFSGWFGESVKLGDPVPALGEFYGGALRLASEPGTTFNYTDHSFATLGQIVEDVSGRSLDRYMREHIFEPLGMANTDLLRSERGTPRLATGYRLRSDGARAVTDRQWVTAAASSIYSTPRDMARYVAALLAGGSGERGSILDPETLATVFEPHYRTDPRLPGMGLGFFREDLGGHLAVEHQGILPGFNSQIYLAPDDGVGVLGFTNGARNAVVWLTAEMGRLLGDLIGAPADGIRIDVPHRPEIWSDLCGWYKPIAQRTDTQALGFVGVGAEVLVRRGQLVLRAMSPIPAVYRGFPLHPDDANDPYAFRIDLSQYGLGTARVVFSGEGATTRVHLGGGVPLSARKRPASRNPRSWATGAAGALAAAAAVKAILRARGKPYKGV